MSELPLIAAIYCALVLAVCLGLWWWYDHRDRLRNEGQRRTVSFHCIRCDRLYVAPAGTELMACPHCGHQNPRLKF